MAFSGVSLQLRSRILMFAANRDLDYEFWIIIQEAKQIFNIFLIYNISNF